MPALAIHHLLAQSTVIMAQYISDLGKLTFLQYTVLNSVLSFIFFGEIFQYSDVSFSFNLQCASKSYTLSCSSTHSDYGPVYHLSGITQFLVIYCSKYGRIFDFLGEILQYSDVSLSFIFQCASMSYTSARRTVQ